ncbi:HipA N-terminal domain-containing protein [Nocardia rhizosphaerae]|uniref:HipA N-terminal domain-containing protein n=1 Tax=Nocardia rhizosphaerae TaxID=1691571 RepID=A0ABV8KZE1_9NOCA
MRSWRRWGWLCPTKDRLTTYIGGQRVGWFTQVNGPDIAFVFDDEWRTNAGRVELSLSMPKSRRAHRGPAPANRATHPDTSHWRVHNLSSRWPEVTQDGPFRSGAPRPLTATAPLRRAPGIKIGAAGWPERW